MKNITLTIGIPAFNEEHNIESFLLSLFQQKFRKVKLDHIYVYSDSSSDRTNKIVKNLAKNYPVIKLIEGRSRKGKYYRVNQLFALNKSDVLVILDADIALVGDTFMETLAKAAIADRSALMVSAHVDLIRSKGFIAKVLHTSFVMWDYIRLNVPGGDSANNFHGAATAYTYAFTSSTTIPEGLSDPHLYIYLAAKKREGFRYCFGAKILQYPPRTMEDLKKILNRSIGKRDPKLEKIFGEAMIRKVHIVSKKARLKGIWQTLKKYPFYTPLAILMNIYISRFLTTKKVKTSPIWDITHSTKATIPYAK